MNPSAQHKIETQPRRWSARPVDAAGFAPSSVRRLPMASGRAVLSSGGYAAVASGFALHAEAIHAELPHPT